MIFYLSCVLFCFALWRVDRRIGEKDQHGYARNTLEIVRATIDDLELIVPLFDGYRQFYKQPSDLAGARRFLKSHFEQDTSVIFLAFSTDEARQRQACGFTQLYPSFSSVSMKRVWILNDLFVSPTTRRTGVAPRYWNAPASSPAKHPPKDSP